MPPAVIAQVDSAWSSLFARAMSNNFMVVPAPLAQSVTAYFAPAFTIGLADTVLAMAALVVAVAFVIFLGMKRGLKGSLMTPPGPGAGAPAGGNASGSEM